MKRGEAVEHIKLELLDFVKSYNLASEKAKPHRLRQYSDGILAMLEGFGMKPPLNEKAYDYRSNEDRCIVNQALDYFTWEKEDDSLNA